MKQFLLTTLAFFSAATFVIADEKRDCRPLELGKKAPTIVLKGDLGSKVDGSPWSSDSLKDKVHVLFYVDPDESDLNDHVSEHLKKQKFGDNFATVAVINMDATWLPNVAISSKLEDKQEQYPSTVYVKDLEQTLSKAWCLGLDDNNDVLAFDKQGHPVFVHLGKLDDADIKALVQAIRTNL